MLWCEAARTDARATEQLGVFASQLAALGLPAVVDVASVPAGLNRNVRFDLAPRLAAGPPAATDRIVLTGAEALVDARLVGLRRLAAGGTRAAIAFGRFESRQAMIGLRARLSYVFGEDPEVVNLGEGEPVPFDADAPVFGVPRPGRRVAPGGRPRLLVAGPALGDPAQVAALMALAVSRQFDLAVLTDGEAKRAWLAARGTGVPIYNYGELLPVDMADRVDVLACFGPLPTNYRLQCLVANLAVGGAALLDCSADHGVAAGADAFIRAPIDLVGLGPFVTADILPNLGELAVQTRESAFARRLDGGRIAALLGGEAPGAVAPRRRGGAARVVFMPTNGVGLGHAQRCTLIAATLDAARSKAEFAAFPSCTGLIKGYGFDVMPMIPRSHLHARSYENDLANYVRLKALTAGARTLVFDGGYVFDSVYRTIVENRLAGVWLRRGLWQAGQDNTTALDRGKVFDRVIIPTEAFEELNEPPMQGDGLHRVGPVVQRPKLAAEARARLRTALAERYGVAFDRLVVTQLGAGVAADRGAQIQAVCGMMERRADVLHLILVWPTATLQPAWFGWGRSRVVRTRHAGVLAACADLCVSAAGYNSFHEILYGALPAILIPQTGDFMDDQTARARAARDRELAAYVAPHEMMGLDRAVVRMLDEGEAGALRRRLQGWALPEPGNAAAGALIEEVTHGRGALEQPAVADRSAGRR